jgi:hypothetical protein
MLLWVHDADKRLLVWGLPSTYFATSRYNGHSQLRQAALLTSGPVDTRIVSRPWDLIVEEAAWVPESSKLQKTRTPLCSPTKKYL